MNHVSKIIIIIIINKKDKNENQRKKKIKKKTVRRGTGVRVQREILFLIFLLFASFSDL